MKQIKFLIQLTRTIDEVNWCFDWSWRNFLADCSKYLDILFRICFFGIIFRGATQSGLQPTKSRRELKINVGVNRNLKLMRITTQINLWIFNYIYFDFLNVFGDLRISCFLLLVWSIIKESVQLKWRWTWWKIYSAALTRASATSTAMAASARA